MTKQISLGKLESKLRGVEIKELPGFSKSAKGKLLFVLRNYNNRGRSDSPTK